MSEQVGESCRQYMAENVASHDDLSEADAVIALEVGFRRFARDQEGWDDIDFHVDTNGFAKDAIKKYRNI